MAATILVVGFLGLIQAVTAGTEALDTARKQQIALQLIDTEIERLRSEPWSTLSGLPDSATLTIGMDGTITGDKTAFALANFTTTTADDDTTLSALAPGFTCSFVRARLRPAAATATTVTYLSVTYTVRWTSNTGRAYSRVETAYFGRNGLHLSHRRT